MLAYDFSFQCGPNAYVHISQIFVTLLFCGATGQRQCVW